MFFFDECVAFYGFFRNMFLFAFAKSCKFVSQKSRNMFSIQTANNNNGISFHCCCLLQNKKKNVLKIWHENTQQKLQICFCFMFNRRVDDILRCDSIFFCYSMRCFALNWISHGKLLIIFCFMSHANSDHFAICIRISECVLKIDVLNFSKHKHIHWRNQQVSLTEEKLGPLIVSIFGGIIRIHF